MKRKLILLDLLLLTAIGGLGWRLREVWLEARKREAVVLRKPVRPLPAPPWTPLAPLPRLQAAGYAEVAQRMLFSRDRNPTVVLDVAPPKPMPPLPVVHGVINLGDGPTAIMSPKPGAQHRAFRAGEVVGEFKLLAISDREIALEWDGKTIRKKVEELIDRSVAPVAKAGAESAAPRPAAPPTGPAISSASSAAGPGASMGAEAKACLPGDNSPPGAVINGMRKVVSESPFGKVCRWEPAK